MTIFIPQNLLVPNERERRQMFHLLKKHSSLTAWQRILGYYQKWADITEESVRQADEQGLLPKTKGDMGQTSIYYEDYVDITKGLALLDTGVRRLAKGDKRVFEAGSLFDNTYDYVTYYEKSKNKMEVGDTRWDETTPLMKEFFAALDDFCSAWLECARYIIEPEYPGHGIKLCYSLWHMVFLPQFPYPEYLPEVPKPVDIVEVRTGDSIPCSGIWEPMEGSTCIGGLNYLHGGRPAPSLKQKYRDRTDLEYGCEGTIVDATWRLIWRDDRYQYRSIPVEEQDYRFIEPCLRDEYYPGGEPTDFLERHRLQNPLLGDASRDDVFCEGGKVCPRDGLWWSPSSLEGQGRFKKGDVMPSFVITKYGSTVWFRMKD